VHLVVFIAHIIIMSVIFKYSALQLQVCLINSVQFSPRHFKACPCSDFDCNNSHWCDCRCRSK